MEIKCERCAKHPKAFFATGILSIIALVGLIQMCNTLFINRDGHAFYVAMLVTYGSMIAGYFLDPHRLERIANAEKEEHQED